MMVGSKVVGRGSFPDALYIARDGDDWVVGRDYRELVESMADKSVGESVLVARYNLDKLDEVMLSVVRVDENGTLVIVG